MSVQSPRFNVEGALGDFKLPKTKIGEVATILAAHVVFYLPFRAPCKNLFEVLYKKALNINISLSKASQKTLYCVPPG